jgi:hypothetical protein
MISKRPVKSNVLFDKICQFFFCSRFNIVQTIDKIDVELLRNQSNIYQNRKIIEIKNIFL